MRIIAALVLVTLTTAACDTFAPAGPDPNRPSLFGPTAPAAAPANPAPAAEIPAYLRESSQPAYALPVAGYLSQPYPGYLSQPYPGQQHVLQQQQMQLNQGISQQATSRDSLSQQLQRGTMLDQINQSNLQQQINLDRTRP